MPSKLPPGPSHPNVVNLYLTQRRTKTFLESAAREFGEIFTVALPRGRVMVCVSNPALVEQIFSEPSDVLMGDKGAEVLVGSKSVLVVSGEEHTRARKLLYPPLTRDHVQHYHDLMEQVCAAELPTWPLRQQLAMFPLLERIALDVIMGAVFGTTTGANIDAIKSRLGDLLATRDKPVVMAMMMIRSPGSKPPKFMVKTDPFQGVVVAEIERAQQDPQLDERDDILAMLVKSQYEDGTKPSMEELRDHAVTMLVQGHQSISITLAWAIERLTRHPEVLDRLRSELQAGNDEYLDAVINETLRLRPPVPLIVREVAQTYQLGEYEFEPEVRLAANGFALHRREDLYPEPEKYRPERFLGEKPGKFSWIPFGGGVRYCIGRNFADHEVKYVLGQVVQQFRFGPAPPGDEGVRRRGIQWTPKEGAQAVLQERLAAPVAA